MTRFLAILAALTCAASAQTYRTVTADTNNVIRTNFTLGAAQVSGAFAISNITGLQSALDGKLATNGDAAALTNFPALLLTTNSSESVFPSSLLRTNGDGSGLTNLPNANLTNATGVLGLANGGTGQTNAALAIEALLPAYTNNADKILALNSNATSLIWTTNAGGTNANVVNLADTTNGVTNTLGLANGGTGGTNANSALTSLALYTTNGGVRLGTNTTTTKGVAIGGAALTDTNQSIAIGFTAKAYTDGVAIGRYSEANAMTSLQGGVAVGNVAFATTNGGVAVGFSSYASGGVGIGHDAGANDGVGIGSNAYTVSGLAIGQNTVSDGPLTAAIGANAKAYDGVQILAGTNTTTNTIQFLSAGRVDTNEWSALANAGTVGTNLLRSTNITGAQAAIFTNTTTNAPTNTNAPTPDAWLDIRVGTNDYKLPLWQ